MLQCNAPVTDLLRRERERARTRVRERARNDTRLHYTRLKI